MGEGLESYVKDLFAGTFDCIDEKIKMDEYNRTFSYLGNQNNPPDIILKNGDAIEIKKIETKTSGLALNSSYPKSKIYSNSTMITDKCRNCEDWIEKDIIYAVGYVSSKEKIIKSLCFVYGVDYVANPEVYERVKNGIKSGILSIPDIEFEKNTKELGRVNKVDPLGITYLRVRGMWHIQNPFKTFSYLFDSESETFNFMAIINEKKYNSLFNKVEFEQFVKDNDNIIIVDEKIKCPDNPAKLIKVKLIKILF